jgi:hypothetical protein
MAHYAEITDGVVQRVIVVNNEDTADADGNEMDAIGEAFCTNLLGGTWKRTSYNGNYRARFAGKGMTFDAGRDAFITVQPFPSWTLDANYQWQAPVAEPDDDNRHTWNETTQSWDSA